MRGNITKRTGAQGTAYRVRVELPRDEQGRRRSRSVTCKTKREAERELARILHEIETGQYLQPETITVAEYLQRWLSDAAKPSVRRATYSRYEVAVRRHITPALGSMPLQKLRPLHLQRLYADLVDDGMAPAGVRRVHSALHVALGQAVRWRMLMLNPADGVTLPKLAAREVRVLDAAETARLLAAAERPDAQHRARLRAPLMVTVGTGLRRGELLGLRWCDIDFKTGSLAVVQTLREDGQGLYVESPKTARGRRRIALSETIIAALRAHRVEQDAERLKAGPAWREGNYVFAALGGGPWAPSNFGRAFRALLRRTGGRDDAGRPIPPLVCRFHDLRHTHASQLLACGVHPKVVSERLGHGSIGITLDTYSHLLPGLQEQAMERWEAAMGGALRAESVTER